MKFCNPMDENRSMALEERLKRMLKAQVSLTITDNTRSIISVKSKNRTHSIRLHHMFLDADEAVLTSLAAYVSGSLHQVGGWLRAFIRENRMKIRKRHGTHKPRQARIDPQGRYVSLQDAFERLNTSYFEDKVRCAITWGNRKRRPGKKRVRLGSYSPYSNVIRINPLLDRPGVPSYVIEHVVYHEMLHQQLGMRKSNGRRLCHHEAFREKEKAFARREEAQTWIRENFSRLLKKGRSS
ncbi:MAG: hypothetical protein MUO52_10570 [Desulfobacterales bacterium]|nr:hypothetical protein [Desulfobacterales bacterium]